MTSVQIEQRLEILQRELDSLKRQVAQSKGQNEWESIVGTFANDPLFEKAMRYGAEYRRSTRPKPRKRHKKRS